MNDDDIFMAAAQIEDKGLQAAFLDSVCQKDPEQRARLQGLLDRFGDWEGSWESFAQRVSFPVRHAELTEQLLKTTSTLPGGSAASPSPSSEEGLRGDRVPSLQPGMQFASYAIEACVGMGGMGEVYAARDRVLDRCVAIKILPERFLQNAHWVQRFEREAKAASSLNHPNILTIFEVGKRETFHFLVSEFVEGVTLREAIRLRSLDAASYLSMGIQVASALEAAHRARLVHRDMKPENIMIRPDGLVKVLDFGIAKQMVSDAAGPLATTPNDTQGGLLVGTMSYMSPEQMQGLGVDGRSDVYGLGLVLFESLYGTPPFSGLLRQESSGIAWSRLEPVSQLAWLKSEMQPILEKCLRLEPAQRFQQVSEVVGSLQSIQQRAVQNLDRLNLNRPNLDRPKDGHLRLGGELGADVGESLGRESAWEIPEVRYAQSGQVNIAYQVVGTGGMDLVFVMGWVSHLEWFWREPHFSSFLKRLAGFARVILFDKRGTGLSDRVPLDQLPSLEQRMDDVRAVMEAVGSERAVLCGVSEGGPMCSLFAATYPERTLALIMIGSYARRLHADDYPWGPTEAQRQVFLDEIRRSWGGPVGIVSRAPSLANDETFRRWWATYLRMGASPGAALALTEMNAQIDVRPILETIQVPSLVIHRSGDQCLRVEEGRYLAERIPGAKFVELPGKDHLPFVGEQEEILKAIEDFLFGVRQVSTVDRVLATVLIAKPHPLSSPDQGAERQRWIIFGSHFAKEMQLFRGNPMGLAEGRYGATFDGPGRAVRAGLAIRDSANRLGLELQIGLHTGECEFGEGTVTGRGVEMAHRICETASSHRVMVSGTLKDLVAGAGIRFAEAGQPPIQDEHGIWRLFEAIG